MSNPTQSQQQQDFYDKDFKTVASRDMEESIRRFYFEFIEEIFERNGGPLAGQRILEIGTGQGAIMERMVRRYPGCHFEGIDISHKNVEIARAKGLNVHQGDGNHLKMSKKFDGIYGTAILHHLDDLPAFFQQVSSLLKPGGWVMFGPEPVWYAFTYIVYHQARGSWPIEKGMMNISITNLKRLMSPGFSNLKFYRHGTPFVYFNRSLGRIWNTLHLSKIPFLNDIYVYGQKSGNF